jgi:hypothetical protein
LASGENSHNAIRSIYQNTIDYDTPPMFDLPLPDVIALQNLSKPKAVDLWANAIDTESMDVELSFYIHSVSNTHCGITLSSNRWININPNQGWLGSCQVTVRVNDSIKTTEGSFWVNIVPVQGKMVLPLIFNNCQ